jgi:hypothetical protein
MSGPVKKPPVPPVLPAPPEYATREVRENRLSDLPVRSALQLVAAVVADPRKQKEFQEYIEAVRRAGFAEGYAAAKMESALGGVRSPEKLSKEKVDRPVASYISKTPFEITKTLTFDYLREVAPRLVGPTEIVKNVSAGGTEVAYTTVKRSLDALVKAGSAEKIGAKRWRLRIVTADSVKPIRLMT